MKKQILACLLALASASLAGAQTRTRPLDPKIDSLFPARPADYLTDVAGVVRNPDVVNARLKEIRESDGLSLTVVTLPTAKGRAIEDVAREIGRKWMVATANDTIGAAVRNTGGVILLVTDVRKCRVEVATGSEGYMTDSRAADACRAAASSFKAGDFAAGFVVIANAFDAYHRGVVASVPRQGGPTTAARGQHVGSGVAVVLFVILFLVVVVFIFAAVMFGSRSGATVIFPTTGSSPDGSSAPGVASSSSSDDASSSSGGSDSFGGGGGGSDY